jgi:hypothetical protein
MKPIAVLYEHPDWFVRLFAVLERRGIPHVGIAAHKHRFDPAARSARYGLVLNRVSASSYLRGHASAIFHAREYLAHLEQIGVPVVNGTAAYALDTSKALQLRLMADLGLPYPRSRVVNHVDQIQSAAMELVFPIIVKPNIGGSGALMRHFGTLAELQAAHADGALDGVLGLDSTAIVQEYHPSPDGSIVRVEVLDGRFLYAIRIHTDPNLGFNICPADICQAPGTEVPSSPVGANMDLSPLDAPVRKPLKIEAVSPPDWVVEAILRIFRAADVDVGGVEYLQSERDGQIYFYDVNTLSNFVTDAPTLLGFDPTERFVDYLERRAGVAAVAAAVS